MTHEEAMTPPFTIKTVELDDEAKEHLKRTIAGYKWPHEDDKTEAQLNDLVKELSPKTYTLNEAMHLALDGAKVCHDGYFVDSGEVKVEYVIMESSFFQSVIDDTESRVFHTDDVPKSGWRIYKEPKVTYKGFQKVVAYLMAKDGNRLRSIKEDDLPVVVAEYDISSDQIVIYQECNDLFMLNNASWVAYVAC